MTRAAELIGLPGLAFAGFLPDDLQLITVYAAAVTAEAKLPAAAAAFIAFITGPAGAPAELRLGRGAVAPLVLGL